MLIVVTVLLSDFIPLRERGTYQGYLNLIGVIGSTSGGPIGRSALEAGGLGKVRLTADLKVDSLCRASAGDGQ